MYLPRDSDCANHRLDTLLIVTIVKSAGKHIKTKRTLPTDEMEWYTAEGHITSLRRRMRFSGVVFV